MAGEGRVVEGDLRVEADQALDGVPSGGRSRGRSASGLTSTRSASLASIVADEALGDRHEPPCSWAAAGRSRTPARGPASRAARGADRRASRDDRLRVRSAATSSISTPPSAEPMSTIRRLRPVEDRRRGSTPGRCRRPAPTSTLRTVMPLMSMPRIAPGDRLGLVGVGRELHAAGLAAAADEDLGLDHDLVGACRRRIRSAAARASAAVRATSHGGTGQALGERAATSRRLPGSSRGGALLGRPRRPWIGGREGDGTAPSAGADRRGPAGPGPRSG